MQLNPKLVGAGVAAAIAAGLGYALLAAQDDETEFKTLEREGAFSVRDYPRLLVAETVSLGMRESALSRGFLALADYICGKDRDGARIPMTVPVLFDGDDDGRGWRTRFVMPARYTVETLPAPGEEVAIRSLPARRIAAVRFAGEASDAVLDAHEDALRGWMRGHRLRAAGPVEHAFYNPPFTPGLLRRNEVLIPLAA
ncbi:heme-binding protein [Sphingomonas sp. LB-2]|nr:heme-binding protein [Sphingomonas caeni]